MKPTPESNGFSERLTKLEQRLEAEEKSRLKRFGVWCGVAALLISIVTGVLGLYDRIVLQPNRAETVREREASHELSRTVNRIARINTEASLIPEDDKTRAERLYTFGLEKSLLLDRADELVTKDGARARPNGFLLLIFEYIQLGKAQVALRYIEKVEASTNDQRSLDDAKRYRAAAAYLPGVERDLDTARGLFSKLVDSMDYKTDPHTNEYLILVYGHWIQMESTYGDCEEARSQYDAFTEKVKNRTIPSESVDNWRERIRKHLALRGCQIEIENP